MRFLDRTELRGSLFSPEGKASGGGKIGPEAVTPGESEHVGGAGNPPTPYVNNKPTGESDTGGAAGGVSGSALGSRPSSGQGAGGSDLGGVGGTGGGTGGGGGQTALGEHATGAGTDLGGGMDSGSGSDREEMAESIKRNTGQR
jgi:hypothetical protein